MSLTERNTKKDIYAAYQAALKQVQEGNDANPDRRRTFQKTENAKVLAMTTETTPETIVKELGDFRLKANEVISSLEDQMVAKKQKHDQIQIAIRLSEEELKNVHDIVKEADSLAALVNAQELEKESFSQEMEDMRQEWRQEQVVHGTWVDDRDKALEQSRKRTEEQYRFDQSVLRRNDADAWAVEKVSREEAVTARELAVGVLENRMAELETLVGEYDVTLAAAVAEATDIAKKKADLSNGFETRALKKDHETATQISAAKIETLAEKVVDLTVANKDLVDKVSAATSQVQTIAQEAIKGAQARIVAPSQDPTGKR